MHRREVLKYTALLTGAAVGVPLAASLLSGCTSDKAAGEQSALKFVSPVDFVLLSALVDTILPATDSPSATDIGVHHTIDHMVGVVYSEEDRDKWQSNFNALSEYLNGPDNKFTSLSESEKLDLLRPLDVAGNEDPAATGLRDIKQQAIAYYLSSEKVSKEYLNFLPVPGEYKPCIQLDEVGGKAWAI